MKIIEKCVAVDWDRTRDLTRTFCSFTCDSTIRSMKQNYQKKNTDEKFF